MKALRILSSILILAVIGLGITAYYSRQQMNESREDVAPLQEAIKGLELDNGTKAITIEEHDKDTAILQGELDQAHESLAVQYLIAERYKNETKSLVIYIEFMQELCAANGITYPFYVLN